ncbi:MAG: glycosyltransferase family 1 protein [Actinobacteria bacterium]|nr:MAG: glycosyltransferase family 1 protein [Actinomycetota bacterium]
MTAARRWSGSGWSRGSTCCSWDGSSRRTTRTCWWRRSLCAPTEVGGTHPVILEALAAGNCVLVNDHRPNAETVGDAGIYFSGGLGVDDLTVQLERLLNDPELVGDYRRRALERAREYSWDTVTDQYERLLKAVYEARGPGPLPPFLVDREPVAVG